MMHRNVKVEAKAGSEGLIDWKIDGTKAKDSKIQFKKDDLDVVVKFKFDDDTGHGLRFNRQSPIWVHENEHGQCPPKGAASEQIEVLSCDDDTLELINRNAKESTLRYQLNFVDKGNNAQHCDPEFKNGGKTFQ
jgi:hypothetical protein